MARPALAALALSGLSLFAGCSQREPGSVSATRPAAGLGGFVLLSCWFDRAYLAASPQEPVDTPVQQSRVIPSNHDTTASLILPVTVTVTVVSQSTNLSV